MQYELTIGNDSLIAKSKERLNFQPKDWRVNFKKDIIDALKSMTSQKPYLFAKLQTTENGFFDVENVLFYNIGTSVFKGFDTNGVWFIFDKSNASKEYPYIHQYSFVDSIDENRNGVIAEWKNVVIDRPTTSKKPLDYWLAFKKSQHVITYEHKYSGGFGIYLEIFKPTNHTLNIVNIQKPLIDGIISAFHETCKIEPTALQYLSDSSGISFETIVGFIKNGATCLPEREVIQQYRGGIKWNPQDEKCTDVRIIVKNSDDGQYKLSGYIFAK